MKHVILSFSSLALASVAIASPQKPNIVIIVADDMGWGDVSYHGSHIQTPNIDRLTSLGIEMDRYYTAPVSSPTRAGLLTGRYPSRFGIRRTVIPPWRDYGLDEHEQTLADLLGENGYSNRAAIGKWHLGHSREVYHPLRRGFTYFMGCYNGAIDYFTHERDGELDWHRNWESCYDKGYSTDLITREAVQCIDKFSGEDPFFVYVAFNAPHSPFQAPEQDIYKLIAKDKFAMLTDKQKNGYIYQAMVERMDYGVGEILGALKDKGELDNTIVLFMSDNGGVAGIPSGSTCKPLRGNKFQEWDGGVRVPSAIYWKKGFKNGRKTDQVIGFIDIVPTIAEIIGVQKNPTRAYDGISMFSLLKGEENSIDRDLYLGCGSVVNQNWKLILCGQNSQMKIDTDYLVKYSIDKFESQNSIKGNENIAERLKKIAIKYDNIVPFHAELPYDYGKKYFITPKEWRITKP